MWKNKIIHKLDNTILNTHYIFVIYINIIIMSALEFYRCL